MKIVTYELFFRTSKYEMLTGERYKEKEEARKKLISLNKSLLRRGNTQDYYVMAKVTKEYFK